MKERNGTWLVNEERERKMKNWERITTEDDITNIRRQYSKTVEESKTKH